MVQDNKWFQDTINAFKILEDQFKILNKENKNMGTKKFAIFMNNGDIITIDAATFTWADDDTLIFYDASIDDNIVAIFKQNVLFGVSECCFELHEKQLMLPKYDDKDKSGMETVEC